MNLPYQTRVYLGNDRYGTIVPPHPEYPLPSDDYAAVVVDGEVGHRHYKPCELYAIRTSPIVCNQKKCRDCAFVGEPYCQRYGEHHWELTLSNLGFGAKRRPVSPPPFCQDEE